MRALVLLACLAVLPGCLERKITVVSEPPGATVWLNDVEVGRTPCTTGFMYYGEYDVRLQKEGFEPVSTHKSARTPLWEIPPIDLAATALPVTITRDVQWRFDLDPAPTGDAEGLVARARELQARAAAPAGK